MGLQQVACDVGAWNWDAIGDIATWTVGVAAAALTWQAYRLSKAINGRDSKRAKIAAHSYCVMAMFEMRSLSSRAQSLSPFVSDVATNLPEAKPLALFKTMKKMPEFQPSQYIGTSPAIGDLPRNLALDISGFVAHANELNVYFLMIVNVTNDFDNEDEASKFLAAAPPALISLHRNLSELVENADRAIAGIRDYIVDGSP